MLRQKGQQLITALEKGCRICRAGFGPMVVTVVHDEKQILEAGMEIKDARKNDNKSRNKGKERL